MAVNAARSQSNESSSSSSRPATLRTRSTGGLLISTKAAGLDNEFDAVEIPSPILSTPRQGLDQLSESLAQLINNNNSQRRHSHEPSMDGKIPFDTTFRRSSYSAQGKEVGNHLLLPAFLEDTRPVRNASSGSNTPPAGSHNNASVNIIPSMADKNIPKSPTGPSKSIMTATGSNTSTSVGQSALSMLRQASTDRQQAGPSSSAATSPPESGNSTPRHLFSVKVKPQVTETSHLQLQTHAPSGRRMINQYIIETELGRGVHGKVRLARNTETGERVAVKIVEREGKKRLGMGPRALMKEETSAASFKGKAPERQNGSADSSSTRTHFVDQPNLPNKSDNPVNSLVLKYGKKGSNNKEDEGREAEKAMARKRQLWTTDKKVKREIALLKKCAHENVVQLKEVIDDPSSKKIFMVLEFMEGGEVQWKDDRGFPTLTVDEARRTLRDVVLGLEYLHYQGIIHRDIKPANLLWDANRKVKISDFGVSHFSYALLVASGGLPSLDSDEDRMKDPSLVDDHELAKTAGSPAFFAPELCLSGETLNTADSQALSPDRSIGWEDRGSEFPWSQIARNSPRQGSTESNKAPITPSRKSRPPITKAIDVWALGVTLYCLLFGHVPFMADSEYALFAAIPREDYELPAYMGADRIRVGFRKRRWSYMPQWKDEEADVDSEHEVEAEADVDPSTLGEEARLVRDLLDRLLEKDPSKRIKLDEVKKHPWLVRDLEDPPLWLSETDPTQLPSVEVSNEEVDHALTGFSKLKQTFKKIQNRLLAGLGVPSHHPSERSDRRMQGFGRPATRQRSKSASHASPVLLLSSMTPQTAANTGSNTPATLPKPAAALRPMIYSRRQSATASEVKGLPKDDTSAPSRPHSPAILEHSTTVPSASGVQEDKNDHLEASRTFPPPPNRRPSSFFKRAVSGRDTPLLSRTKTSTDAVLSSAQSSRPSSNAGTLRTDLDLSRSDDVHSNLESEAAGHISDVFGSQMNQGLTQDSDPLATNSRTRSRSRLGDVLRNVLGHHDRSSIAKPPSRPGTAPNNTASSSTRGSNRSLRPVSSAYAVTPIVLPQEQTTKSEEGNQAAENSNDFLALPVSHLEDQEGLRPQSIEVDDYDVDLELSDDDLDEEKGHTLLRNSGQGWVMERDNSSSASSRLLNNRTPSVEGGYNLYKSPYSGHVINQDDEIESYAMAQVHSDEAEALRRASAKEMENSQRDSQHNHHHHHHQPQEIDLNDLSNMTDDRFADAEEEDSTAIYDDDDDEEKSGEEDDGVSFQARARGHS